MKSREDFKTKADYKEYLYIYYSGLCLQSVGNSGLLGGTSPYIAAMRMARDMVEAVVPEDMAIPHPMKDNSSSATPTEVAWITKRYLSAEEIDKIIESNKKWEEEQRKKFETGFSEVFLTNPNNNFIGNDAEVDFPVCCTSIPIIERVKG